jgi:hypothetical protein
VTDDGDIRKQFAAKWNIYTTKYNELAEEMEKAGIDSNLLIEVVKLKESLVKMKIERQTDV